MLKSFLGRAVRVGVKPILRPNFSVAFQRRWVNGLTAMLPPPRGTKVHRQPMGALPAECLTFGEPAADLAILYLHGGGYNIGSARSYRVVTGRIARAAGVCVYTPDYRLAPEHPHPAALEDALSAYRWLRQQGVRHIALAGDSAGGGLVLATALALRDAGDQRPAALALMSPWTDLATRGETMKTHVKRDPSQSPDGLARWARGYANGLPLDHPLCSPLYADLRGLPPILVHVGSEEILLSDSLRLRERAFAAGVEIQVREFEGLWHDFQLHTGLLREADESLTELGQFLRERLDGCQVRNPA
ncbi:alpha/beta hydrolase [Oleomonas cavernae]|nr:alpha/beta hydrolase [Oleomonas cavernae]